MGLGDVHSNYHCKRKQSNSHKDLSVIERLPAHWAETMARDKKLGWLYGQVRAT